MKILIQNLDWAKKYTTDIAIHQIFQFIDHHLTAVPANVSNVTVRHWQQDRMKDITDKSGEITVEEIELENYFTYQAPREELYMDLLQQNACPKLAPVACDILAFP